MVASHTAPCKIAPRPVRKKYCPDNSELRHGVQLGAVTKALRKTTPCFAMRSMVGVFTTSLIVGRPSSPA